MSEKPNEHRRDTGFTLSDGRKISVIQVRNTKTREVTYEAKKSEDQAAIDELVVNSKPKKVKAATKPATKPAAKTKPVDLKDLDKKGGK